MGAVHLEQGEDKEFRYESPVVKCFYPFLTLTCIYINRARKFILLNVNFYVGTMRTMD